MAEIGFYHLTTDRLEQALPRLLAKVLASGRRAVLRVGTAERLEALDRQLWTYDKASFLPHGTRSDGHGERQPIWLTTGDDRPNGAEVLLLVDGASLGPGDAYDRVLLLFDGGDPAAMTTARERWSDWRAAGHDLAYFQQDQGGRWNEARRVAAAPSSEPPPG